MIYPGSQLGPYLIDRELGRGGSALVYHAVDERTGGDVALKVLAPDDAHNPALLRRFQQEGEIALRLRHPNIVRAHDVGTLEGYHYIALDYAARGTLATLVEQRQEPIALNETVQLLRRVALALDYAHSRDLLHRDVKPSNILIGPNNQIWLADFGIARRLDAEYIMLTASAQPMGTPSFMSPEQIRHDAEIDGRSDIYNLGVVAYKLLSGGLPFEAKTQVTLLHRIAYDPPTPPQKHNSRLQPGTCYVLEQVLAKNPAVRFATAAAFIDALADSPHHKPSKAEWEQLRRESALLPDLDSPGEHAAVAKPARGPGRQTPLLGLLLAVALLLVVGAGVYVFGDWFGFGATPVATEVALLVAPTPSAALTASATVQPPTLVPTETLSSAVVNVDTPAPIETATASATAEPTFTLTPVPTSTAVSEDTVGTPSAAQQADASATQIMQIVTTTDTTTDTSTVPATVELISTVALTSTTKLPTSTPVPELVTDTPTPTEMPTATEIPPPIRLTPSRRPASSQPTSVTDRGNAVTISAELLSPTENDTVNGSRTFVWNPLGVLPAGYRFEPVFWMSSQDPLTDGQGWGGSTAENQLVIDLTKFPEIQSGSYKWGVLLVQIDPYKRIDLISEARTIIVKRPNNSSGDNPGPEGPKNPDRP